MSITDPNSVLIVGAGASVDFGLPLGGELIQKTADYLLREGWTQRKGHFDQYYPAPPYLGNYIRERMKGFDNPIAAALAKLAIHGRDRYTENDLEETQNLAIELGGLLDNQTSETIDDFISQNPSHSALTKLLLAAQFVACLYEKPSRDGYSAELKKLSARTLSNRANSKETQKEQRNWIHLLINIVRHGLENPREPSHKIKVISFNYDGILERVLSDQFMNTEKLKPLKEEGKTYRDYFQILHPHGLCSELTDSASDDPWSLPLEWSKNIFVVNEPAEDLPEQITLDRELAREWIYEAKKIYAAGFAFSRPNCRGILGLERNPNCVLTYCNYDNDIGLDLAVENAVHPELLNSDHQPAFRDYSRIVKAAGTPERPLSIANWIRAGYLGEMPG